MKQTRINPVDAGALVFGSKVALAKRLGISRQSLNAWRLKGVPAERALEFSRVTGLPRSLVRPDLYPQDQEITSQSVVACA
jgi:DNA-binding transcriptional regulator YdaS (Cro superfamily)